MGSDYDFLAATSALLGVQVITMVFIFIFAAVALVISIGVYLIAGYGWYKFYKYQGGWYQQYAWLAWIPYANTFIAGAFLQEANEEPEWVKWVVGLYPVAAYAPYLGSLLVFAGSIFAIVEYMKYFVKIKASVLVYITYFLFPIVTPFILLNELKAGK